ncbi:tyrosine-type recombinase/integrase [Microbacterium lacticum]
MKVPLGKLNATQRMVPLDPETLEVIDRVAQIRSHGRPLPHPRYRRPTQFLFTYLGRRLTQQGVRRELDHAAETAGLGHVTSHQLRHTYATALVNAGVSLQALMALLGHQSAEMSLRYGRLFDATVRTEYERALDLAKQNTTAAAAGDTAGRTQLPLTVITGGRDWEDTPLLKSRMAGGFCLRTPAQEDAATRTSASTARPTGQNPHHGRFSPRNASTPKPSPATRKSEDGSTRPTATTSSSPASTRSSPTRETQTG